MGTLHATIVDATTREPRECTVRVTDCTGRFVSPHDSLLKVGPGQPAFYCPGEFLVDVDLGRTEIVVERGTEYAPLRRTVSVPKDGSVEVELELRRWTDLPSRGWYPGNTHIHYSEKEQRPDDRLKLEPHVHDFSVTVVSRLQRRELPYASNKYPLGVMTDLTTAHHVVDVGEENRHNDTPWHFGYGHVMFLNLRNVVSPVSRGCLIGDSDPDYPPLCFACDDARDEGGVVLWCHNGLGMEAPVAAALGKLDAFNLFDPYWMDPEYDLWYKLLNCGFRLPASTGSDWFVCSNNRVYVQTGEQFDYAAWLSGMKEGRTFITNGPALFLTVNGEAPGGGVRAGRLECAVSWMSHYPVNRVDLVHNGAVVRQRDFPAGGEQGKVQVAVDAPTDGWLAARCFGDARDSFGHAVFAHTSPVYVSGGAANPESRASARFFSNQIDESLNWIAAKGRFHHDSQRREVMELFKRGREVYGRS
jgi:hypothetical protein